MSGDAVYLLQLKAVGLGSVRIFYLVHFAEKHIQRAYPEPAVTVKLAVYDIGSAGLGIVGKILYKIVIALEMAVYAFKF